MHITLPMRFYHIGACEPVMQYAFEHVRDAGKCQLRAFSGDGILSRNRVHLAAAATLTIIHTLNTFALLSYALL
jgi:hypothetical protein